MANKGRSEPNLFGGYTHYDDKGHKIGRSDPGLFGGYTNYDAKGNKVGHSDPGILGGYTHYDNKGHKIGSSSPGLFGGATHYDRTGHKTGSSSPEVTGGYTHSDAEGCYIATCVYGSYDCPEVWTLRRFRDETLGSHLLGREFIRVYYALSPTLVKWFGRTHLFQRIWKTRLDRVVALLQERGVEDTPYNDKGWRKR